MNVMKQVTEEARSAFRTMVNNQVQLTLLDDESNIDLMANCRDISSSGIALEIEHPVEVGTRLKIQFCDDEQVGIALADAIGKVIRCEQETSQLFLLAVELINCE